MIDIEILVGIKSLAALLPLGLVLSIGAYYCLNRGKVAWLVAAVVAVAGLLAILPFALAPYGHDESQHWHAAWLLSQGKTPFTDFWDMHSPLLWALLAPLLRVCGETPFIFIAGRALNLALTIGIVMLGWKLARKIWSDEANWPTFLIVIVAACAPAQPFYFRPDLFNAALMLLSVYFCVELLKGRLRDCLLAGLAAAAALTITPKQFLVVLLPPIVILVQFRKAAPRRLGAWCLGSALGALPLGWYLLSHGILAEFYRWVFVFHRIYVLPSMLYPAVTVMLAVVGWIILWRRNPPALPLGPGHVLMGAFVLSTLSTVARFVLGCKYYLMLWFVFVAVLSAGISLRWFQERFHKSRVVVCAALGLGLAMLLLPSIKLAWGLRGTSPLREFRNLQSLQRVCRGDTCVMAGAIHPIFAEDAIPIFLEWHFRILGYDADLAELVRKAGPAETILSKRPALLSQHYEASELTDYLADCKVISFQDRDRIRDMLSKDYTLKKLGGKSYYLRKDRVGQ